MSAASRDAMAPPGAVEYFSTGVLGWLIPGAGYWLLGYRVRAVVLGSLLLGLFWVGETPLGENHAVSRATSPVFYWGQLGNGLSTLLANEFWGAPDPATADFPNIDRDLPRHLNLGLLCTVISGLLNVLLVLHTLDPRTWAEARAATKGGAT